MPSLPYSLILTRSSFQDHSPQCTAPTYRPRAWCAVALSVAHPGKAYYFAQLEADTDRATPFPPQCRVNHSCCPNAVLSYEHTSSLEGITVRLLCIQPIGAGEEANVSYLSLAAGSRPQSRREILEQSFGFTCRCRRVSNSIYVN
jgi:hypothetical protein